MKLSVVIASCNDANETVKTLFSIRETAGDKPEIIIVDDCSATPLSCYVKPEDAVLITNAHRCGCGPSRYIGAHYATGEYIMILDSHMRMTPGWYEKTVQRIEARPHTLHCGHCLGLDAKNMDPAHPVGDYYGGTITLSGPNKLKPDSWQVMEAVWLDSEPGDDAEIAAPLGAIYVAHRETFLKLCPTRFDRIWGSDEVSLAFKYYLSGGDVRYMKHVRIGHKFLMKGERQGFKTAAGYSVFNKLFLIHTLIPFPLMRDSLHAKLASISPPMEWNAGLQLFHRDYHLVAQELALNHTLFKPGAFQRYRDRFGLTYEV